jgi:DNA-binding FadR family transcriptional regulator
VKKRDKKKPSIRNTVSKEITTKLLRGILDGTYPAGSKLPNERELAETFSVTRNVIREALKRIETVGMITIRQGSGALVEDVRRRGGIELVDLFLYGEGGSYDIEFMRDIVQFHEVTTVAVVRLAAKNITQEELENLGRLATERGRASGIDERIVRLTVDISRAIIYASQNRYIPLLFNSLERVTRAFQTVFQMPAYFDPGIQTYFERLTEAFQTRDEEMAALLTHRVFGAHRERLLRIMSELPKE